MRIRQFSFHITILQISILLIVSLFLVFTNTIFVKDLLMNEQKLHYDNASKNFYIQLNNELNNLDRASFYIDSILKSNKIDSSIIIQALNLNDQKGVVDLVGVYDFGSNKIDYESFFYCKEYNGCSNFDEIEGDLFRLNASSNKSMCLLKSPSVNALNSILYLKKISKSRIIVFQIHQNFISTIVHSLFSNSDVNSIYIVGNQKIILSSNSDKATSKVLSTIVEKQKVVNSNLTKEFSSIEMIDFEDSKYIIYSQYNSEMGLNFVCISNRSSAFPYFYSYLRKSTFVVFIVFIITTLFLFLTNNRSVSPINDILELMQNNSYSKIRKNNTSDEFLVIRKGVESLYNQLNHYVLNLEKNKHDAIKLNHDLELAKRLQRNILPANDYFDDEPRTFEIFAISKPLYEVGGDMYDFFMIDNNHLLVAIGDITGKGIAGSLYMIFALSMLRSIAKPGLKVEEIVSNLNYKLSEENISDQFATMFVGIIDLSTNKLSFTNAAHSPPYIIHYEGVIDKVEEVHGIPVGIYSDRVYSSSEIQMYEGDTLFLYTDGLIESKDENNIVYSDEVLRYNLIGTWFLNAKEIVDKIEVSVKSFRGNVKADDDLSLLALKLFRK